LWSLRGKQALRGCAPDPDTITTAGTIGDPKAFLMQALLSNLVSAGRLADSPQICRHPPAGLLRQRTGNLLKKFRSVHF
jgi:hypothetical protein